MKTPFIVSNNRLLCKSEVISLFSRGHKLYFRRCNDDFEIPLGPIPVSDILRVSSEFRLLRRIFRLEPRCGIALDEHNFLVSFHGAIYRVCVDEKRITKEHEFRIGMNNPLSFCNIEGISGFDEGVVYGEYFGNLNNENVDIYQRRNEDKVWHRIYSFPPGMVKHIHKILIHPTRKSVIVLTGDEDNESAIWEFRHNFNDMKVLVQGAQRYRACVAFPFGEGLVFATDTPKENNAIYFYKPGTPPEKLFDISGPCIYGTTLNIDDFVFATSVEPDSNNTGLNYTFSYKLGPGVKDWYSHIYIGNPRKGFKEVFRARKDFLPMLLFQFGNFLFPSGEYSELYVTGQSLLNYDGKTARINFE